ncbi:MAG TPA: mandelate racemase/muconate lactonizing enzyme family protein [Terriglobales bacterium]|jgi:L-alanine-DL-glutamate epimerase-like enolase superfamily enzyme|nr:mandelate racemase/muconate lactonizing enzyme family protein [Terriglobales bacterium]
MKITKVETAVLEVPLDVPIADAQSRLDKWGLLYVQIHTDEGITGCGYNSNTGAGARSLKTLMDYDIAPQLIGRDVFMVKRIWEEIYLRTHFTGVTGVSVQGLAAPEIAMWDAIAKRLQQPLWKILGGYESSQLPTYNTDGGWLSLSQSELVERMRRLADQGWHGMKMKVGGPDPAVDYERVGAVRKAIGPGVKLMVDANTNWDVPTAIKWTRRLADFDIFWMEEPVHPFDVGGNAQVARAVETPLALGENIHSVHMWRDMFEQRAVGIVQADALKLGGISSWLQVAWMAHAYSLPVVPSVWDMMQLNVHLCASIPNAFKVEFIPWISKIFLRPVEFVDGYLKVPQEPGAGTEISPSALEKYRVA